MKDNMKWKIIEQINHIIKANKDKKQAVEYIKVVKVKNNNMYKWMENFTPQTESVIDFRNIPLAYRLHVDETLSSIPDLLDGKAWSKEHS